LPEEEGLVSVRAPEGAELGYQCHGNSVALSLTNGRLAPGDPIEVVYGDTSLGSPGIRMTLAAREARFLIHVQSDDEAAVEAACSPAIFHLHPARAAKLQLKAPSSLVRGETGRLLLKAIDTFGNTAGPLTSPVHLSPIVGVEMPDEAALADRGKALASFQARTGETLPAQVKRLRVHAIDRATGLDTRSNPVELLPSGGGERIFWGDLHTHTALGHASGTLQGLYEYARDEERLDFVAHVEHYAWEDTRWMNPEWRKWGGGISSVQEYIERTWEFRKETLREYHEPGRFVAFLGFEWSVNVYGDACVYYLSDDEPVFAPDSHSDPSSTPDVLWRHLEGREAIVVAHHTSFPVGWCRPPRRDRGLGGYNWDYYNADLMPVVEIYSKQGSSEYFGCPLAVPYQDRTGCVREALDRGHRLGFIACTDTNLARPGSYSAWEKRYRQPGLTAVFAPQLEREAIFRAIQRRRCYATTGERIIVRFWVEDAFMGESLRLDSPGEPKEIRLDVAGTDVIDEIEVVKNGDSIFRYCTRGAAEHIRSDHYSEAFDDREPSQPNDYYYLRIRQADGALAWSSPIWIDTETGENQ